MIHSLLGQSEVLTLSGTVFLLNNHSTLGYVLICFGIVGALGRYGSNLGFLSKQIDGVETNENSEKSSILAEYSKRYTS